MRGPIFITKRPPVTDLEAHRIAKWAPHHPPCWSSHEEWVEYLLWCHGSNEVEFTPLLRSNSHATKRQAKRSQCAVINASLPFCRDCTPEYERRMHAAGRCQRSWLKDEMWRNQTVVSSCDAL